MDTNSQKTGETQHTPGPWSAGATALAGPIAEPLPKLVWHKLNTHDALEIVCGTPSPKKGRVIVSRGRRVKVYTFKRRAGDGHFVTRWGRLVGATVCRDNADNGRVVSVVFDVEPRSPRAAIAKAEAR